MMNMDGIRLTKPLETFMSVDENQFGGLVYHLEKCLSQVPMKDSKIDLKPSVMTRLNPDGPEGEIEIYFALGTDDQLIDNFCSVLNGKGIEHSFYTDQVTDFPSGFKARVDVDLNENNKKLKAPSEEESEQKLHIKGVLINFSLFLKAKAGEELYQISKRFDHFLNSLAADDMFGTEGQNDPRGDQRNGGERPHFEEVFDNFQKFIDQKKSEMDLERIAKGLDKFFDELVEDGVCGKEGESDPRGDQRGKKGNVCLKENKKEQRPKDKSDLEIGQLVLVKDPEENPNKLYPGYVKKINDDMVGVDSQKKMGISMMKEKNILFPQRGDYVEGFISPDGEKIQGSTEGWIVDIIEPETDQADDCHVIEIEDKNFQFQKIRLNHIEFIKKE